MVGYGSYLTKQGDWRASAQTPAKARHHSRVNYKVHHKPISAPETTCLQKTRTNLGIKATEGRRGSLAARMAFALTSFCLWREKAPHRKLTNRAGSHHPRYKDLLTMSKGTPWRTPCLTLASLVGFLLDSCHRRMQEA